MADSQKKSANIINATSPSDYARTTVTPLANGGVELSITNATWTNCRYTNIPVTANSTYTITVYIDEYSGTGTFMIPCRQIDAGGTAIFIDTIGSTGTKTHTFTAEGSTVWLGVYLNNSGTAATATAKIRIMLNEGSTPLSYEPYGWQHSLRKLTTATEAVENPLYSDGTAITAYTIKGNTVQNGTPTPTNPVDVNGVGEMTENLFDTRGQRLSSFINSTGNVVSDTTSVGWISSGFIEVTAGAQYTFNPNSTEGLTAKHFFYDANKIGISGSAISSGKRTFIVPAGAKYAKFSYRDTSENIMLNTGSTAKPYEPYGYFIEIEVS